jgi:hypothetical protein
MLNPPNTTGLLCLDKHQEKFSGWCIGRAGNNFRGGFEYFLKSFNGFDGLS